MSKKKIYSATFYSYSMLWVGVAWLRPSLSRSTTSLNSNFYFYYTDCHTRVEDPSLPYYLPIAGRRIIACISFLRVFIVDNIFDGGIFSLVNLCFLCLQVLRLLYHLVKFGYYLDKDDVLQLLPPLLKLLDGRGDYPFYKDKEKGKLKQQKKLTVKTFYKNRDFKCWFLR